MMQRMSAFELLRCTAQKNELREAVKVWESVGTISAALSVATGSKQELNQALRVSSTHRAVTTGQVANPEGSQVANGDRPGQIGDLSGTPRVEVWDRLRAVDGSTYLVDYIIPGTPYSQLFLTREDPAGREDADA